MPCTDGGIPYHDSRGDTDTSRSRKLEAMLCGVLSFFRDNTVGAVTINYATGTTMKLRSLQKLLSMLTTVPQRTCFC